MRQSRRWKALGQSTTIIAIITIPPERQHQDLFGLHRNNSNSVLIVIDSNNICSSVFIVFDFYGFQFVAFIHGFRPCCFCTVFNVVPSMSSFFVCSRCVMASRATFRHHDDFQKCPLVLHTAAVMMPSRAVSVAVARITHSYGYVFQTMVPS